MTYLVLFVIAVAVVGLGWCLFGLLLMPVFGTDMVTVYFVQGDGVWLEQRVRAYGWLRESRVRGSRLLLADCGLTAHGVQRVQLLQKRYNWLEYTTKDAVILPSGGGSAT